MSYDAKTTVSNLADVRRSLIGRLDCLQRRQVLDAKALDDLETARWLLECLPFETSQFDLARSRLTNAERYLRSRERGAARYEIRLLLASLRNGDPEARVPNGLPCGYQKR